MLSNIIIAFQKPTHTQRLIIYYMDLYLRHTHLCPDIYAHIMTILTKHL